MNTMRKMKQARGKDSANEKSDLVLYLQSFSMQLILHFLPSRIGIAPELFLSLTEAFMKTPNAQVIFHSSFLLV